jgi:hypothetical protein
MGHDVTALCGCQLVEQLQIRFLNLFFGFFCGLGVMPSVTQFPKKDIEEAAQVFSSFSKPFSGPSSPVVSRYTLIVTGPNNVVQTFEEVSFFFFFFLQNSFFCVLQGNSPKGRILTSVKVTSRTFLR